MNSREDAEDILQDVWQQLSSVVSVDQIDQMSGWLHTVAGRNRFRNITPDEKERIRTERKNAGTIEKSAATRFPHSYLGGLFLRWKD